ncbi:bacillithiol biosynthesis cysteine-adding enzyme BshC [candidate division KSB1 bacterium]|nr:bacillithiol biosynthesis cysteine-adding enzyme BshC [candidate division KSB1 bacterium]
MPGVKPLVADYLTDFTKVSEFYNGDYRQPKDFLDRTDSVKSRKLPLGQLVPILKEQNQKFGCGVQTLEKIDLLLERRACAVVTGQQTGLFGGPLFTIYKALTAIKLAERLSRTCEGCFVPVFWLASDDHDFLEVNHININDKSNQPLKITYNGHSSDNKIPVSEIKLNDQVDSLLQKLDDETNPSEFKAEILNQLSAAYLPETIFSQAFGAWLTALFKTFGLILIDASDTRIKKLGATVFRKEIAEDSPSTQSAIAASTRLNEKNYHSQVQLKQSFLNLFYVERERNSIEIKDGSFSVKGTENSFTKDELLHKLETQPERFSPNVLLRPLYQDALLPTVAYVAGSAELAYYAQMKGIYDVFDIPMPVIYPRKSLTLLEGKIEKVLDNYDLKVPDFWNNVEALINEIAKAQLPESLEKRIRCASLCVNKNLQALEDTVIEFEPTLKNTVENVKGRILGQMDGLEKKILQAYKKRNEVIGQQIHKAQNSLYPNNNFQERQLNILPYLFKYGLGFIDQLYESLDISNFEHQVIKI